MNTFINFHDNGLPVCIGKDIIPIDSSICYPENWVEGHLFPYLGYCQDFNENNGTLLAEGYMIFGEDMEMDCERVGQWIIYSQNGDITLKEYGGFKDGYPERLISTGRIHRSVTNINPNTDTPSN